MLFAITVHEVAHGWVASKFGDHTAKHLGRLTLNPLKHLDPIGTVLIPALCFFMGGFIFGWAKPVPINPFNFRNFRRDSALVAIAGPMANLMMALFWAMMAKIGELLVPSIGSGALFLMYSGLAGISINAMLMFLNLIPIPPLDGSRVVSSLLPARAAMSYNALEPYGFIILIFLLITNVLAFILIPLVFGFQDLVATIFGFHWIQ